MQLIDFALIGRFYSLKGYGMCGVFYPCFPTQCASWSHALRLLSASWPCRCLYYWISRLYLHLLHGPCSYVDTIHFSSSSFSSSSSSPSRLLVSFALHPPLLSPFYNPHFTFTLPVPPNYREIPGICWPSQQEPDWEWLPSPCSWALLSLLPCQQCHNHCTTEQEAVWCKAIHRCRIWAQRLVLCGWFHPQWQHCQVSRLNYYMYILSHDSE